MAFRFFVNVDKCLNMHNFDFFFYRKQSLNQLVMYPDVSIGQGTGVPLGKVAFDIRSYLDRNPHDPDALSYDVDDYQIIIAIRRDYVKNPEAWEDTLLSSLLSIDFNLRRANILLHSGLGSEIAVNLLMLYETNRLKEIHAFDTAYLGSSRMEDDCRLLLHEIGVPEGGENDIDAISSAWEAYSAAHAEEFAKCGKLPDGTPAYPLCAFFNELILQYRKDSSEDSGAAAVSVTGAAREVLRGYSVFELFVDKANGSKNVNALLRVVEYVTEDYTAPVGMAKTGQLPELCDEHWKQVSKMDDKAVEAKYGPMLAGYKERLKAYLENAETENDPSEFDSRLPDISVPDENDIGDHSSMFEDDGKKSREFGDPKIKLDEFKKKMHPVRKLAAEWAKTYSSIRSVFEDLGKKLRAYSGGLGKQFADLCRERKRTERTWHNKTYFADEHTKDEISRLQSYREDVLAQLKEPQMTPSLSFQDELNMQAVLEDEDRNIRHYIDCMQSITKKNFFLLAVILLGFVALLYVLFQPYIFKTIPAMLIALGYVVLSFILMMFTWKRPFSLYNRKIKICVDRLKGEMDTYSKGFFDRAIQLHKYVNLINRLDYIDRHIRLTTRAVETSVWISDAKKWHIDQVKIHIEKLDYFAGLINGASVPSSSAAASDGAIDDPVVSREQVDDVIDNKLYWPQT